MKRLSVERHAHFIDLIFLTVYRCLRHRAGSSTIELMAETSLRVAVVQMLSGDDAWANLLVIDSFVKEATEAGVQAIFFPENVLYRGPWSGARSAFLSTNFSDPLSEAIIEISRGWEMDVYLGAVLEATHSKMERPYNSTLRLGFGRNDFVYRKIHLFDYEGAEGRYNESERVSAGEEITCSHSGPAVIGHSICFDLRFPELYRRLVFKGDANTLLVPAAFTSETGRVHWHTMLKSRAIENLSFVLAPAQWGVHLDSSGSKRACFGHSMIISPWGEILCEADSRGDALLIADLDYSMLENMRRCLPSLKAARLF